MTSRLAYALRGASSLQWTIASAYVVTVAAVAAAGFFGDSTSLILLAAAIALPASVFALPGYYLAYGLLALVPGANPDESSGSGSCVAGADCSSSTTGDLADWFVTTTDVVGVLALACAAALNCLALRLLTNRRRRRSVAPY